MRKKQANLAAEIKRREDYNLLCPFPYYDTEIINDLKIREKMISKLADYNNVPVFYCKTCLSIHLKEVTFEGKKNPITGEDHKVRYCVPCGNTETASTHITEWEDFYEEKYGEKFINKK